MNRNLEPFDSLGKEMTKWMVQSGFLLDAERGVIKGCCLKPKEPSIKMRKHFCALRLDHSKKNTKSSEKHRVQISGSRIEEVENKKMKRKSLLRPIPKNYINNIITEYSSEEAETRYQLGAGKVILQVRLNVEEVFGSRGT